MIHNNTNANYNRLLTHIFYHITLIVFFLVNGFTLSKSKSTEVDQSKQQQQRRQNKAHGSQTELNTKE